MVSPASCQTPPTIAGTNTSRSPTSRGCRHILESAHFRQPLSTTPTPQEETLVTLSIEPLRHSFRCQDLDRVWACQPLSRSIRQVRPGTFRRYRAPHLPPPETFPHAPRDLRETREDSRAPQRQRSLALRELRHGEAAKIGARRSI